MTRTGGRILVDQLRVHGADTVFCVPGESYLPVLDALNDVASQIRLVVCRHEGGAAYMAESYGKLTGRPGVCFVSRGPGATNASIGVHAAFQDSSPMILFIGQVPRSQRGRQAFQEIDHAQMFSAIAKWAVEVDDPKRLPEMLARAFQIAVSGRPGPVVMALPEDILTEEASVTDADPFRRVQAYPDPAEMARLRELLAQAERPLMIAGGSGWTPGATADLRAFAEANEIPVATSFRRQDIFDNSSPCYAGTFGLRTNPYLQERVAEADLLLLAGTRPDAITSGGYSLLDVPRPQQRLIHVHADLQELGRVYQADVAINSGPREFAAAARALPAIVNQGWKAWAASLHRDFLACLEARTPGAEPVDMVEVMAHLRQRLPGDAIITNGAGDYTVWCQRHYAFTTYPSQVAPQVGSMGYGLPAAVAAKCLYPERVAVCFAGDGCFLMNGQELATAVQYGLDVLVLVINNGMYGSIRRYQERIYPGRAFGTGLVNPDFAAYARAFGAHGEVVERTAEFPAALERALAAGRSALIELRVPTREQLGFMSHQPDAWRD
jgi:acetolactate synthase-1/2/3 large subunit